MIDLDAVEPSTALLIHGHQELVPSRRDYLVSLLRHGIRESDLPTEPRVVEAIYRHWATFPQIACAFARRIARNPASFGVKTEVLSTVVADRADARTAALQITSGLNSALTCSRTKAMTIILPGVNSPLGLVLLCMALRDIEESWILVDHPNPSDLHGRIYVQLKLRVQQYGEKVVEVLGFAPFDFCPITRRAPFVALESLTEPSLITAKTKKGPRQAPKGHLADLHWNSERDGNLADLWTASEEVRLAVLGGDDSAAKARVSFAIPRTLWYQENLEGA